MPFYHTLGQVPRKRHTVFRRPDGGLYSEQLMGNEGFTGPSALLYHIHPPTTVLTVRRTRDLRWERDLDLALRHRHFRTRALPKGGSPTLDRIPLLFNNDIAMLWSEPDVEDAHFFRNAQADEVVYLVEGAGTLESQFGLLPVKPGDYVVLPRGIMHRWRFTSPAKMLIMESRGYVRTPKRYRTEFGQIAEGAPYSERDFRRPTELVTFDEKGEFPVIVKQYNGLTEMVLDHHPFDVVGWDGFFYPWAFNIHDFEPIVGRIHQPPPVHQTFAGPNFVVCSFVPRPFDFDPDAVKVPYHHANVDTDEVLFYSRGNFMSRAGSGIGAGSISLHPPGFVHGPQPGSRERSADADRTEELAVMLDAFRPLALSDTALAASDPDYPFSWSR